MDFIQALREADAAGIPREQFMMVWENETRLKQTENELRLHLLRTEGEKKQIYGDSTTIINQLESQLQSFNTHQQHILANLKGELQQQNQALIADISILLEGFASQVGRVVKGELQTALEGIKLGANPSLAKSEQVVVSDHGSNNTWSEVHRAQEISASISSTGTHGGYVENPIDQPIEVNGCGVWNGAGQVIQVQQQEATDSVIVADKANCEQPIRNKQGASQPRTFSSLFKGTVNGKKEDLSKKEDLNPRGLFFPQNGSANMMVMEMSGIAHTGKITSSPIYHLQESPCKVQLSFWSSAQMEIRMCLKVSNASPQPIHVPQVLTISGGVYNWKSLKYTSLFYLKTPPFELHTQQSQEIQLPLVLTTSRGSYPNVTVEMLFMRGYVCDNRDCLSIDWTVRSKSHGV